MATTRITARMLSDRYGCSARFWEYRRPAMVKAGLLNKIGRSYFGDLLAIDRAVATAGPETWES